jgi:Arc/MetJ family transcription regulator
MRTNIEIDDKLMAKAQKLTKIKTKKAVVEKALEVLVQLENQKILLDYWGKIHLDEKAFE